jgi:rubrerythrin
MYLIDVEKLLSEHSSKFTPEQLDVLENFDEVDAAPVVRGKWVEDGAYMFVCSICKHRAEFSENYCPNCGARMERDAQ